MTTGQENQDDLKRIVSAEAARVETTIRLSHRILLISEDRLELKLKEGMSRLSNQSAWAVPVSILVSCVITLATSTFHSLFGIAPNVWQAIFYLLTFCSFIWLLTCLRYCINYTSQEFLAAIRSASSTFNEPTVTQTKPSSPLQTIVQMQPQRPAERLSYEDFVKATSRLVTQASAEERDARQAVGANALTNVLQCRHCGGSMMGATRGPAICTTCKQVS